MRSTKQEQSRPIEDVILDAVITTKMSVEDYARQYGIVTWTRGNVKDVRLDN
jgi:hypothetical protein